MTPWQDSLDTWSNEVQFPTKKAMYWDKISYLKGTHVKLHHEGVHSACEGELVCQIEKYFVIPLCSKDPLSNLIDLFLKTCLVLKNKSIELKVINTIINFKWLIFWLSWASITPEILEYIFADNFHALWCYPWGVTWVCMQCMLHEQPFWLCKPLKYFRKFLNKLTLMFWFL